MTDLPAKFWINADSGKIIPVQHMHAITVLLVPHSFALPFGMKGTEFAETAARARQGKSTEADMFNSKILHLAFDRGWVRVDRTNHSEISIESPYMRDTAKALGILIDQGNWFEGVYLDFIYAPAGQSRDSIHLTDEEEIARFSKTGRLPVRYGAIPSKRRVSPDRIPGDTPMTAPNLARDLTAPMESLEAMIEARRPTTKTRTGKLNFADPTSQGELVAAGHTPPASVRARSNQIPGRQARPGEAGRIQAPGNSAAMAAFNDLTKDLGPDTVSDDQARIGAGTDQTRLGGQPQNALVSLNQLPAVVGQETGEDVSIVWHKVSSLPNYVVNQIRAAFRPLFKGMLNAELEEISVASTLPGAGTRPGDLEALWNFLMHRGQVDDSFNLEAFGIDPDVYHVNESHVVTFGGHKFYLMTEVHGHMGTFRYIYVAPGKGEAQAQVGAGQQQLQ